MTTEAAIGSCSENDFPESGHSLKVSVCVCVCVCLCVCVCVCVCVRERVKQSF